MILTCQYHPGKIWSPGEAQTLRQTGTTRGTARSYLIDSKMAVRVGFEPTEPVKVQRFSRPPDSTTLAPHQPVIDTYSLTGHSDVSQIRRSTVSYKRSGVLGAARMAAVATNLGGCASRFAIRAAVVAAF